MAKIKKLRFKVIQTSMSEANISDGEGGTEQRLVYSVLLQPDPESRNYANASVFQIGLFENPEYVIGSNVYVTIEG